MGETSLNQPSLEPLAPEVSRRPLCVDLDGTLVKSDTLMDSLLLLLRSRPLDALQVSAVAAARQSRCEGGGGRARGARCAASAVQPVCHRISRSGARRRAQAVSGDGRRSNPCASGLPIIWVCSTACWPATAQTNLTAGNKLDGLRRTFGDEGYDYIGNAGPDLPLLSTRERR